MGVLCRDCFEGFAEQPGDRCPGCGSPRLIAHPELESLSIAHIDCDAFYASVEKRDRPELAERPVIVGGGRRGVVSACCYIARIYGVRSAMPMFKALKACPDAVVLRPDMQKYQAIGQQIRTMMREVTPLVEPLSIDEAFLDLSGTELLHRGSPARTLARLVRRIRDVHELTASVGLSYNKFLAKIASDLDKPDGFSVIGQSDALEFLSDKPVSLIWGVGKSLQRSLARAGITRVGQLRAYDEADLVARFGAIGRRLSRFSWGRDDRHVDPNAPTKSISSEATFETDIADLVVLSERLWPLCETVAGRLKKHRLAGQSITLKLKTSDFKILSRSRMLADPTCLAEVLYRTARELLTREADGRQFRLIGVGASALTDGAAADPPDLLDPARGRQAKVEAAIDEVRSKLGKDAILKGRGLQSEQRVNSPAPTKAPKRATPPSR